MDSWGVAIVFVIVATILQIFNFQEIEGMVNGIAEMLLQSLDITKLSN